MKFSYRNSFPVLLLIFLLALPTAYGVCGQKADIVLVSKSERRLDLVNKNGIFASFPITLGANPVGHKERQGDERTPEGHYLLDYKNSSSKFYKSIHISYPNHKDRVNARKLGVYPGGDIMIHGQKNGLGWASPVIQFFLWTNGCIALHDEDMDLVWAAVDPGTPIEIQP